MIRSRRKYGIDLNGDAYLLILKNKRRIGREIGSTPNDRREYILTPDDKSRRTALCEWTGGAIFMEAKER